MALRALVETGFMLALNPRDRHHEWAMNVLEEAARGRLALYISPAAPIELSLVMRAKGRRNSDVLRALRAVEGVVRRFTKPRFPPLGLEELAYAAELRIRYPSLTFFDSIHASVAILNKLTYYDLDEAVREVVASELRS